MHRNIFIACPISKYFESGAGLDPEYKHFLQEVRKECLEVSHRAFLALEREAWGDALMDGVEAVPLDYEELRATDAVIAFPEDSYGVAVELGWASALGKPLLVFTDQRFPYSPLIRAIHTICPAAVVSYHHRGYREALPFVRESIREFLRTRVHKCGQPFSRCTSDSCASIVVAP